LSNPYRILITLIALLF